MNHHRELKARLEAFFHEPVSIEPLAGGITNQNFRVQTAGGRLFAARLFEDLPHLGIDRRNEVTCQRAAARLGLAPELLHEAPGLLISHMAPGRTLSAADLADPGLIRPVGEALRALHESWDVITGHMLAFCPFRTIRTLAQSARELGARLPRQIDALIEDARRLEHRIAPYRPVLCHNDLLPANLVWDGMRIWLIDWEYAGMGHPLFDLASVSAGAGFDDEQDRALLTSYRGAIHDQDLEHMRVFKVASLLREALWAILQTVSSSIAFDYHEYAARNLEAYRTARKELVA